MIREDRQFAGTPVPLRMIGGGDKLKRVAGIFQRHRRLAAGRQRMVEEFELSV